jgi:hypothetical protein
MAKFGFDVTEVEADAPVSYDPIPDGEYVLKALDAEEKTTAKGDGSYIKVKFEVANGDYAGRFIWQNFNVNNPSEKAQRIGRQQIVAWATACGKPDANDTDKLLDAKFKAAVSIEKGTGGYSDSNRIKAFLFDSEASKPSKPAASKPAASKPAPAAAGNKPNPWD